MGEDVIGEILYFSHTTDDCSPWTEAGTRVVSETTNMKQVPIHVPIHDLRGKEKSIDFDTNGVEVLQYENSFQEEFPDNSKTQQAYYEELSDVLKKHLGAARVVAYQHVFRSRSTLYAGDQCNQSHRNPAFVPHVDSGPVQIRMKLKEILGEEEAEKAMRKRFQAINAWRPIGPHPVTYRPLTICDYRSIDVEKDVHLIELRGSINSSTSYTISCSSQNVHKWYYLSRMRSHEMFIFKTFDSKPDVAQYAFHVAFVNENVPPPNVEEKKH